MVTSHVYCRNVEKNTLKKADFDRHFVHEGKLSIIFSGADFRGYCHLSVAHVSFKFTSEGLEEN